MMIILSEGWNNFIGLVLFVGAVYGMYRFVMYRKTQLADRVVGKGSGSSADSVTKKHK